MHKIQVMRHHRNGFGLWSCISEPRENLTFSSFQGAAQGYFSALRLELESKVSVFVSLNTSACPMQQTQMEAVLDYLMAYAKDEYQDLDYPVDNKLKRMFGNGNLQRFIRDYSTKVSALYFLFLKIRGI